MGLRRDDRRCPWTWGKCGPGTRRRGWAPISSMVFLATLLMLAALGGPAASPAAAAEGALLAEYAVVVPPNGTHRIDVRLTVSVQADTAEAGVSADIMLPEGVAVTDVATDETASLVYISDRVVRVSSDLSPHVSVTYPLHLPSSATNPAGLPGAPYASVHAGQFVYLAGRDTLARIIDEKPVSATVKVAAPDGWRVFTAGAGFFESQTPIPVTDVDSVLLVVGPLAVARRTAADAHVTVVAAGQLPWGVEETADSLHALVSELADRGFAEFLAPITMLQLQYPGTLRLNPLVSGLVASDNTIVHWVGAGSIDWWRKHAARDVVRWLVKRTVMTAPDAAWFAAGLPEYVALLLLHDAGFASDDELYQGLYALHAAGVHYTGPGWPSLVLAGVASPRSHSAQRVLEFRAPLVAFLLDAEIRRSTEGSKSLIDLWLDAARLTRREPGVLLYTSSILAISPEYGDLSSFAEDFLFGSRIPPVNFDAVYQRWLQTR